MVVPTKHLGFPSDKATRADAVKQTICMRADVMSERWAPYSRSQIVRNEFVFDPGWLYLGADCDTTMHGATFYAGFRPKCPHRLPAVLTLHLDCPGILSPRAGQCGIRRPSYSPRCLIFRLCAKTSTSAPRCLSAFLSLHPASGGDRRRITRDFAESKQHHPIEPLDTERRPDDVLVISESPGFRRSLSPATNKCLLIATVRLLCRLRHAV